MKNYKRILLIDLDGVLNQYDGNYNENIIPPIKDGAFEFIQKISENFKVKIFSVRNRLSVSAWVIKNGLKDYIDDVTNVKEPCYLIIDDRCIKFNGDYDELSRQIDNFNVWYKNRK